MGNSLVDREEHELRDFDHIEEGKLDRLAYQTRLRGMWLGLHDTCPHIITQPDSVSLCGEDGEREPCIYEVHRGNGDFCQIFRDVLREMHKSTPAYCPACQWEGTYAKCPFGHHDFACPSCLREGVLRVIEGRKVIAEVKF